ncbi:vegetative incompatibility het-e-1 [Fusarium beomiforme]|uniref:Vegetative incompatibility het-e-1 n=1 Tax=Fusarium beomiforme TaxID=44412 RepID=A0A9P5AXA3_9HYPO|nr:vegetative incompatibility het-e-1 [Fusarium beomiforme]
MAEALGVASSVIAVVELSVKVLSLCLQYSREVKNAKDDIERLRNEVATFEATTKGLKALLKGPRGRELKASQRLVSAIEDGHTTLGQLEQQLRPSTGRKAMSRFGVRALKWPFESKDVEGAIQSLERCRGNISLALNIDQTVILQNVDDRTTLHQLPIAHGASFDSKAEEHHPTCLPDTREELLKEIDRWIDGPKSKSIFWLNGMAGTGKSTIARTVARSRSKRGDLGASFFFKRGEVDRGSLNKLMATLAYQLALSMPEVAIFIKKALDANPAIVGKNVKEQFKKLIQEPLSEAATTPTNPLSVVMVIDALDECDQEADMRLLVNIFSQAKTLCPYLRVFLTSRPELPIRLGFSEVQGSYQDFVLHEIPAQIVEHDIVIFLNDEFKKIRSDFNKTVGDERKLPLDWPGRPTVQSLAQMAVPLFIFAATVCRFVGDRKRDSPPIQLRTRRFTVDTSELEEHMPSQLQYACMHWAYHHMEGDPKSNNNDQVHDFLKTHFLHWMEALSLLGRVKECLDSLRSLARWLENREDPNLSTFVADAMRFLQAYFPVIAEAPLQIYSCLAFAPRKSVVRMIFENAIPKWISNLPKVEENWDACLLTLEGHSRWVNSVVFSYDSKKVASGSHDKTIRIWDAETGKCEQILEGHGEEVCSVVFSPDSKKVASASRDKTIWIWNAETGGCQRVLEGHSDWVSSVVFSHESKKVASGSYDKTIRIWNAETGKCEQILEGHSDEVWSVVFSHDSMKVASGSIDKTIRIWNAETGICERELKGHNGNVLAVVFSHDSKKVASASRDMTIRIWNAETGVCEDIISSGGYVDVLSFTPDESGIVTNRGVFPLTGSSQSRAGSATSWQSSGDNMLACQNCTWVTAAGRDLLWLPPECRDGEAAVSGRTIVIGCQSGNVVFLGISMADVEQWTDT